MNNAYRPKVIRTNEGYQLVVTNVRERSSDYNQYIGPIRPTRDRARYDIFTFLYKGPNSRKGNGSGGNGSPLYATNE